MRSFATILSLTIFVSLTGCENGGKRFMFGPSAAPLPTPSGSIQTADQLVDYLNANAANMQSLRCVDIKGDFQGHGFNAKMMAMKPRNFFMTASAFGNTIVDLGSNDNEFWFWSSKAPEPHQFFCSYRDFESGKVTHFPFPFQPDWIMETLGMKTYNQDTKFSVDHDARARTVSLVERTQTPQGVPVRKVIVMSRDPVFSPTPQIRAYRLIHDSTGKEICSAQIQETKTLPTRDQSQNLVGVVVPTSVEFRVPEQKMTLKLTFYGMMLNDLKADSDLAAFQRHEMRGVQSVDLARQPSSGTGR